jgi:hypothetical protein
LETKRKRRKREGVTREGREMRVDGDREEKGRKNIRHTESPGESLTAFTWFM